MADRLPSFDVSAADKGVIRQLAERALHVDRVHNGRDARKSLDWVMDFTAVHANGNPLRLTDLLEASEFNFAHDAFGIARHLDRSTGKLTGFFSPRFSARVAEAA